ncbi:hypothetical protein Hanom_Chr07g00625681 [Helianthus anomalus]
MFVNEANDIVWKKIEERIIDGDSLRRNQHEIKNARKKWFKIMPAERKFRRPLAFFTRNKDISVGDIISWGWIPELKVFAIKREYGVQYFKYLNDIKSLPWWDMKELCRTKLINYQLRQCDQKMWRFIRYEARHNFPT